MSEERTPQAAGEQAVCAVCRCPLPWYSAEAHAQTHDQARDCAEALLSRVMSGESGPSMQHVEALQRIAALETAAALGTGAPGYPCTHREIDRLSGAYVALEGRIAALETAQRVPSAEYRGPRPLRAGTGPFGDLYVSVDTADDQPAKGAPGGVYAVLDAGNQRAPLRGIFTTREQARECARLSPDCPKVEVVGVLLDEVYMDGCLAPPPSVEQPAKTGAPAGMVGVTAEEYAELQRKANWYAYAAGADATKQDIADLALGRLVRQMPEGVALEHQPLMWLVGRMQRDGGIDCRGAESTPEAALRAALGTAAAEEGDAAPAILKLVVDSAVLLVDAGAVPSLSAAHRLLEEGGATFANPGYEAIPLRRYLSVTLTPNPAMLTVGAGARWRVGLHPQTGVAFYERLPEAEEG